MGGKAGPCTHCGITATPLWRRGPPEKPILCNACGSRWRHRGTLAGYMPMQVTGLSTCHVPSGYTIPEEPMVQRVKPAGSLKRKELTEEDSKGMADRLRERKLKEGYESDDSEVSLSRQSSRRKVSPSCSPNSVLPIPRKRPASPQDSSSWGHLSALFSDLNDFDLDLTSAQAFEGLDSDVSLFGSQCKEELKTLDAGQYICGLVVRTRVEALGAPGCRSSPELIAPSDAKASVLKGAPEEAKGSGGALPLSSSARFTLPSHPPPSESAVTLSRVDAKPGPVAVDLAKLQGSDLGKSSPHRASFSETLLFRGGESLNEFMARTGGEKRLGELAGSHAMQGSYDSLDSGASLVIDESCEPPPMVELNPPPQALSSNGEKDLKELHSLFLEPIWDSFDLDGGVADKSFLSGGGQKTA